MLEINDIKEIPEVTFPINLTLIQKHQWEEPSITAKYKDSIYHKVYFCGVINIDLKLITCKDKIVIMSILQSYVVHWPHTHILHPGMNRTKTMIFQYLYWTYIRNSI